MENESLSNLFFRLKNSSSIYFTEPDPPIIQTKGVSIIDWNFSDSDAVNQYVNRLIRFSLKRYFDFKEKDYLNQSDDTIATGYNGQDFMRKVKRLKINYDKKDGLNDEPLVSVFDNLVTFQITKSTIQFNDLNDKKLMDKLKVANLIDELVEADNLMFFIKLKYYFTDMLNVIKNRLLVVIYLNEIYFEKFLKFLIDKEFHFHLVIITPFDDLPALLRKNFKNFKSIDYLKITNSPTQSNCLEIRNYDKTKYKDVLTLISV